MDDRIINYYTNLLEQGVPAPRAAQHAKQTFGLKQSEVRHLMAHCFILDWSEDEGNAIHEALEQVMEDYTTFATARRYIAGGES